MRPVLLGVLVRRFCFACGFEFRAIQRLPRRPSSPLRARPRVAYENHPVRARPPRDARGRHCRNTLIAELAGECQYFSARFIECLCTFGHTGFQVEILVGQIRYCKQHLCLRDSYGLGGQALGTGSICEDSRGRWYINVTVEVKSPPAPVYQASEIRDSTLPSAGIDLGLKEFAACSGGEKLEAQRFYRDLEPALAVAQRANNNYRVKSIHAEIANRRKDHLHKLSRALVNANAALFVGNVNASGLAKTTMAKSVLDAGWKACE